MTIQPADVIPRFAVSGRLIAAERYGNGHINDTFLARCDQAGTEVRYILQRINDRVFPRPGLVMRNIAAVIGHLAASDPGGDPRSRLALIPAQAGGEGFVVDDEGCFWRCYPFIERTRTVELVRRPEEAAGTARAFARFQRLLAGYRGRPLGEVIRDFHHTPARVERLRAAVRADARQRAAAAGEDIAWALSQDRLAGAVVGALAAGAVPVRITHNDTKINNVLFEAEGDQGVCVIDLDTLMPGSSLYDFGDLVRTATATAPEDATDLAAVGSDPALYHALADSWLAELGGTLAPAERELMPVSGALMAYEVGVRFLTDHLEGDTYFRIKRPDHNLDRARNQFALAKSILRRLEGG